MATTSRRTAAQRRHGRIRRTVSGTPERPRLAVFRSNRGIYAQVIDDLAGRTLAAASSLDDDAAGAVPTGDDAPTGKAAIAAAVGRLVAERAKAAGIERVVFDRGGNRYHGRVKALADAARQGGLEF